MGEKNTILLLSRLPFIPRRAVMYVPGDDLRKIAKIPSLSIDCPVLECEDGVALNKKDAARQNIVDTLQTADWVQQRLNSKRDVAVRVNSLSSGLAEQDLSVLFTSKILPTTLLIPKVESKDEVGFISSLLQESLRDRQLPSPLRLILYIESASALLAMKKIAKTALKLGDKSGGLFALDGFVFGSDDFCADIGASRSKEATEVAYARQHFVTVVKSFQRQLQAIDLVHIDYKDTTDLKRQAEEGARWGFTGKQVIHPGQIDIVQQAFSPSPAKLEWAEQLVKAFTEHQKQGKGAFTFRGSMIDRPLLLQAQNILELHSAFDDSVAEGQQDEPQKRADSSSR